MINTINISKNTKKLVVGIFSFLFLSNIIAWSIIYDLDKPKFLEVNYFDVGQGDSIFIETQEGNKILIDGGPTPAVLKKLENKMAFYDKTIDLIILTHPESDHYNGLIEVLKRYKVKNILWTGVVRDTNEWKEWVRLIEKEGADIKIAQAGQRIILQEEPLIFIDVLYPFESLEGQEVKYANETSIVANLFYQDVSFLFTGDIPKKIENQLVENNVYLKSDILKVAHHGSKTSSSDEFIENVLPKLAIISVEKDNQYGHPHIEVLSRLQEFDIQVLRTDLNGDIKILSDGSSFRILGKDF
ncbi:MAG: ComEC/Rec2 family competence protein [Candidatus Nealsonbacteria bacterium]